MIMEKNLIELHLQSCCQTKQISYVMFHLQNVGKIFPQYLKVQFHTILGLPLQILIWEAFEPEIFELWTFWGGKSKHFTSLWIWVAVDVCGRQHLEILATYIPISHFWGDLASEKREIKAFKVMWMLST